MGSKLRKINEINKKKNKKNKFYYLHVQRVRTQIRTARTKILLIWIYLKSFDIHFL